MLSLQDVIAIVKMKAIWTSCWRSTSSSSAPWVLNSYPASTVARAPTQNLRGQAAPQKQPRPDAPRRPQREPTAMTEIHSFTVGLLSVNCYLLYHPESRECLIVDPGDHGDSIQAEVRNLSLQPRGILLTHGHVDHISAVPPSPRPTIPVGFMRPTGAIYSSPANAILQIPAAKDLPEPCDTAPQIAGCSYEIIHTPGHTPVASALLPRRTVPAQRRQSSAVPSAVRISVATPRT